MKNSQSQNYQMIMKKKHKKEHLQNGVLSSAVLVLVIGLLFFYKVEKNYFGDKIVWNEGSVAVKNTGMVDTTTRFEENLNEEENEEFNRLLNNYKSESNDFIRGQLIDISKHQLKIYQLINNDYYNNYYDEQAFKLSITISNEELDGISFGCMTFDYNISSSINRESSLINGHSLILAKGYTRTGSEIYYQAKFNYQDWWYIITSKDEEKILSIVKSILTT